MNLWIRTQDKKTLMLVNTICLAEDEVGTIIGCGIDIRVKLSIGKYKTKERALEVLDEIQEHLDYLNIENINRVDEKGFRVCTIYEMPKE